MAPFNESTQLNDDAFRCPECGKRLNPEVTLCPACGYELLPRRVRIRCNQCGSRVPAETQICPHCHGNPRLERVSPHIKRIIAIAIGGLVLVCLSWIIFRALTTNVVGRALGLNQTPPAPTQVVQVIYIIASPVPPTRTPTPSPTATLTPRPSPTPRRAGATAKPVAPTGAVGLYVAPQIVGPANKTVYTGADANILLEWQSVAPSGLRENEWYQITLTFTGHEASAGERRTFLKETRWTVPGAWRSDLAENARAVNWQVIVVRVESLDPFASPTRVPLSPPSVWRSFFWN